MRELIKTGALPARRVGRQWLIEACALDVFMQAHEPTVKPDDRDDPPATGPAPEPDAWLAEQLAKFTPDDLRRAGELLLALAGSSAVA